MPLVAGVDSSTQSCKVAVVDLNTGAVVREGRASHPRGTWLDPNRWWDALMIAVADAGGLDDVAAIAVSGHGHSTTFIGEDGGSVRDALLWNDTSSHPQVRELNDELGANEWVRRTGSRLTLSDTITKVRWLRNNEPENAARTAAIALPHDWLTWRLMGGGPGNPDFDLLITDRSDASGTAYWSPDTDEYCWDLFEMAFGRRVALPRVLGPQDRAGVTTAGIPGVPAGVPVGVGSGDNAAAALALGLDPGDAVMSLGTSGVVYAHTRNVIHDYTGYVSNYADATGDFLPRAAAMNASRDIDAAKKMLGCSYRALDALALAAEPGADGLTLLPYFEGERTPDLPHARASLHGASLENFTRENFARATIEGMLASQVVLLDSIRACQVPVNRLLLIGGAAKSPAVQKVLTQLVDVPVLLPKPGEYVAKGAGMQAAVALTGEFPVWPPLSEAIPDSPVESVIMQQHRAAKDALGY